MWRNSNTHFPWHCSQGLNGGQIAVVGSNLCTHYKLGSWNYASLLQTRPWQEQMGRPAAAQPLNPLSRMTTFGIFCSFPSIAALFRCSQSIRAHVGPRTCRAPRCFNILPATEPRTASQLLQRLPYAYSENCLATQQTCVSVSKCSLELEKRYLFLRICCLNRQWSIQQWRCILSSSVVHKTCRRWNRCTELSRTWLLAQWKTTVSFPLSSWTSSGSFASKLPLEKCREPAIWPS